MAAPPQSSPPIRAILLDIEGTTTSIDFVCQILFPYFRQHLQEFLEQHASDTRVVSDVKALHDEYAAGQIIQEPFSVARYVNWLMDRDRKSTPLKSLQGKVWGSGYRNGDLRGHVYPDVPCAFRRWRDMGIAIAIFSSGSVLAQRLLFSQTIEGDLSSSLDHYFDTTTGPKKDSRSYAMIAGELGIAPANILFISDTLSELDAARVAGIQTRLCARLRPPADDHGHEAIASFDEVLASTKPMHNS